MYENKHDKKYNNTTRGRGANRGFRGRGRGFRGGGRGGQSDRGGHGRGRYFRGGRGGEGGRGRSDHGNFGRSPPRRRRSPSREREIETHYCMFCKMQLSKGSYSEHKVGAVHQQKESVIRKALKENTHFCYTCEKEFSSKLDLDAHCLMTRHQPLYRVEGITDQLEESDKDSHRASMEAESRGTRSEERGTGKERQKIELKLNERGSEVNEKEKTPKYFCDVCSVDCMSESNFKIHNESWRHRAEEDKLKEENEQKEENADETEAKQWDSGKAQYYDDMNFHCEVCSVAMSDKEMYIQHLRGRKHQRQISLLKRPYRCYVCSMNFTVEKEFNMHLECDSHIVKAFAKKKESKDNENKKTWQPLQDKRNRNNRNHSNRGNFDDDRMNDGQEKQEYHDGFRKVELIPSPSEQRNTSDLRDKLQGKSNIVITRRRNDGSKIDNKAAYGPKLPSPTAKERGSSSGSGKDQQTDANRRAKEYEFEAKFRKLEKEYGGNIHALKERLKKEREDDIKTYQQYETTYTKLCREEDYVRENIRVLDEKDPRKEEYIRDMIRIQNDMREVRLELEIREMMIIKRESLFRARFPNDVNNKVVISPETPEVTNKNSQQQRPISQKSEKIFEEEEEKEETRDGSSDLRVELERERLLKRLAPELSDLDPVLRDKLMNVIMDSQAPAKQQQDGHKNSLRKEEKKKQMELLSEREKQLQKELAALKSNVAQPKKKITKSLVPQYDDVDEKKEARKRAPRRSRSRSSESSGSSSSDSSDDEDDGSHRKDRKRRRRSPSRKSSDRSRNKKRNRRSSSHDRKKKSVSGRRRDDDRKKKADRKKPVKITIKSKSAQKVRGFNPLNEDNESDASDNQQQANDRKSPGQNIQVIGASSITNPVYSMTPEEIYLKQAHELQQMQKKMQKQLSFPPSSSSSTHRQQHPKEQFSMWKKAETATGSQNSTQVPKDSPPKEDVWDIAFSGSKEEVEEEKSDDLTRLFNTNADSPKSLSTEILNILKSVAPNLQNVQQQQKNQESDNLPPTSQRPHEHLPPLRSQDFPEDSRSTSRQFPIPIKDDEKSKSHKSFPSFGKPEMFADTTTIDDSSSSGGRIRSILKKMKDPPQLPAATTIMESPLKTLIISTASTSASVKIPGLDNPQENKPSSPANTKSDPSNRYVVDDGLYNRRSQTDDPIKSDLYRDRLDGDKPRAPANMQHHDDPYDRSRPYSAEYDRRDPYSRENYGDRPPVVREYDRYPHSSAEVLRPRDDFPVGNPPLRPPLDIERDRVTLRERDPPPRSHLPPQSSRDLPYGRNPRNQPPPIRQYDRNEIYSADPYHRGRDPRDLPPPRDTLPPSRDILPPPRDVLEPLQPPVRRAGEAEDEFYIRFERFYEVNRRRDAALRDSLPPSRLPPPEYSGRPPYGRADHRREERYEDRLYRNPPPLSVAERDHYRERESHDGRPPMSRFENERRYEDDRRRMEEPRRDPYNLEMQRPKQQQLEDEGKRSESSEKRKKEETQECKEKIPNERKHSSVTFNRGILPGLDLKREGDRNKPQRDGTKEQSSRYDPYNRY